MGHRSYKGHIVKEYYADDFLQLPVVTFDIHNNTMEVHQLNAEPRRVTLVDTDDNSVTGGRVKRLVT